MSDPDAGNTFVASLCAAPANGTITSGPTIAGNQVCFTYLPNVNFNGVDNVCVIVCDNTGLCDTSTSIITVVPVNDPPVANPDNFVTNEDTPVTGTVISNDSDPDGNMNPTGFAIVSGPSNGTINFSNNGTFTYTPNANYNGSDTFIYMVCDLGMPIYCDTALVTINIVPVNDPPIAVDDIATTPEDTPVSGNVLTNDSDPEGDPLVVVDFTINGTTYPADGSIVTIPGVGTLAIDSTGDFTFNPVLNFNGPVPTVTYMITDGNGGTDAANLNIFVGLVNDPPIALNDTVSTPEDTPVSGNALTNDSDVDGGPLSIVSFIVNGVTYPAGATVNMPGFGVITVYNNGLFDFSPAQNFNGSVPVIPYTITDGNGGMATADIIITVTPVNDPPEISEPAVVTPEDTPITVCTTINDPDAGNTFVASLCAAPSNGTITSGPTVVGNQVCFTYLPNVNFNGVDNVCVIVCDNTGLCDTSTSVITVVPVNDPPIANPDNFTTNEDTPLTGTVITNDSDVDGNLNPNGFAVVSYPTNGTLIFSNNGTFSYTPNTNYNGPDSFIYSVCDMGMPIYCDTAIVNINVIPVNDPPVLVEPTVSTPEDTPIAVCATITDPDAGNTFIASLCGPVANGTITAGPTVVGNQVCFTFAPALNFNGLANVCVTVCDNTGLCNSSTAIINVLPVNDPPIANPDNFTTAEDTPVTGTVISNDSDVDGNLNPTGFAVVTGPTHGTITFSNNGTFTYTPAPNYNGSDNFIYMVCDLGMPVYCDTAIVNINITPANDAPVIFNEHVHLCANSSINVNVLTNGDLDPEGTVLSVNPVLVSGPSHGIAVVVPAGTVTYTPAPGYFGPDMIVVSVCDLGLPLPAVCSNDTVFITVDQPVIADAGLDQQFCDGDKDYITLTGNNVPFATVTWTQVSGPPAIIAPANSSVTAAFINDMPGTYVFQYTVTNGTCSAADQVTYTVTLPPTIANAGPDQILCGSSSTTLAGNVPVIGTGVWNQVSGPSVAVITNPNNPVTNVIGLITGSYTFSWTISNGPLCPPSVDMVVVNITAPATSFAGPNASICEGSTYTLSNSTETNGVSVHWTTSGTGQFNNADILHPTYIPSFNDILDGYVYLTLNVNANAPCPNVSSTMTLFISHTASVNAGPDETICESAGSYALSGSTSQNAVTYSWATSGTGTFFNGGTLHPVYTPSAADIASGMVTLTVTATSAAPCPSVSDAMNLLIKRQAVVNAGPDATICESGNYVLTGATGQYATTYQWTTSGTGSFNNASILNPVYTPSLNDIQDGFVNLTLTGTSIAPCSNASDVMRLNISHQAIVNAGPDAIICETQGSYTISGSTSQYAASYQWTTSGTGTFTNPTSLHPVYNPSPADINFGSVILTVTANSSAPCPSTNDAMVLNISRQAVISAGPDDTICESGTYLVGGSTSAFTTSLQWSTSGTGSFSNANSLHPVYTPSLNDIQDGFVYLVLTATSTGPCTNVTDIMRLNIMHQVSNVYAGVDATICETSTYTLNDATALNAASLHWTTSGTGSFSNIAVLHPTYTPSPADIAAGSVTLTLTANAALPCPAVSDAMTLNISLQAVTSAGPDDVVCENDFYTILGSSAINATTVQWTTTGSGTFNDASLVHAIYTPSPADILDGSIQLILNATSESPCSSAPADTMLLTISHLPVIYAGADTAICQNVNYYLNDATALYAYNIYWTSNGTGTILNDSTLTPTYVPGPGETGVVTLTLHVISSPACGGDAVTDFMYLTIMQSVVANAGADTTIFANNSIALHGSATLGSGAYSYNWQPSSLLIFENTDHPITNPLDTTTVFVVTVTDLVTGCQDQDTVVVTVNGINLPPVAVNDYDTTEYQTCITFPVLLNDYDPENTNLTISLCGPPVNGTVVINSDNTLTYCPYDGFSGIDSLCYQICDEGSPIQCSQATVFIYVKPEFTVDDLIIYNGVSPDGDGNNDVWIISGIEHFPDNEVSIFNRWGDQIANYTHYNNLDISWDGTYKGRQVPDGTYYYILDIKNKKKFAGWIYVKTGK
ncbi:MAG: Ig-like domain-containing protein [Bacteroidota bacterium]